MAQKSKPDLTGTWKLNRGKSKLAPQHGPGDDEYIIGHSEPRIFGCAAARPDGGGFVHSDYNIGIKHSYQPLKITSAQSVEKSINAPSLLHALALGTAEAP